MAKIEKDFGEDKGAWWCGLQGCDFVINVPDLKQEDLLEQISWAVVSDKSAQAQPICPEHGVLLQYAENGKGEDVVLM